VKFFANSFVNRIYMHAAVQGLAEHIGGFFVFVYLLKQGVALPQVLLVLAAFTTCRQINRMLLVPVAKKIGLRNALIVANILTASSYLPLGLSTGLDRFLLLYVLIGSLGESWYHSCMHATQASLGDQEARGAQTSAVQLIFALNGILGPMIGGLLLVTFGPTVSFPIAFCLQTLACLPLLATPNQQIPKQAVISKANKQFAFRVYASDGFFASSVVMWNLGLFLTLGSKFDVFGYVFAFAGLLGAVFGLIIGRFVDLGHGLASTKVACSFGILTVIARVFCVGHPVMAIAAHAFATVMGPLYGSAYNSRVYNLAKQSGDPLRFHVYGEGGWDTGCAVGACIIALLLHLGSSWALPNGLGLLGIAGVFLVLRASFRNHTDTAASGNNQATQESNP
jgi:DHA1 family inner membrane transport protein